jgi:glycosyltransferase involved in cell wall biosynthesis
MGGWIIAVPDLGLPVIGPASDDEVPTTRSTPTLSVLIPCWNSADTIERAMTSILDEHGIALELIVIDDGSTDGTFDAARAVADRDPRVVLVQLESNEGVSVARNRGLAIARGEWLTFLDADDRLLPGAVAALMRPTIDPEVLAVIGQRIWTDGERTWLSPLYDIPDIREPGRKSIATHPGLLYYASATGKAFHRSLVDGRRFAGRVLGDQPWTIHCLLRAGDYVAVIAETVYEWRRPHPDLYISTITAETRTSAERAVEMVSIARTAYLEVSADVDVLVAEEATRSGVKRAYFERLVRSDISDRLRTAITRRDPATGDLLDAIGRFFVAVPVGTMAATDVHLKLIMRSAAYRYSALRSSERSRYWQMIRPILVNDPRSSRRLGGNPILSTAFWLARAFRPPLGEALAGAVLLPASLVARLMRRAGIV